MRHPVYKSGCSGRLVPRKAAFGFFMVMMVMVVLFPGCTDLSADDAERLFAQALDTIRTEGLRPVPAEPASPAMIVRRHGPEWQPSPDVAELAGRAQAVKVADRDTTGGETVLCITLDPDAAKSLLEERLMAELDAVRQDSGVLLQGAMPEGGDGGIAGSIRSRVDEAERQLATMLSAARVETTLYMQVDRRTARPSALHMVTSIVRPAGLQETLTDSFVFA